MIHDGFTTLAVIVGVAAAVGIVADRCDSHSPWPSSPSGSSPDHLVVDPVPRVFAVDFDQLSVTECRAIGAEYSVMLLGCSRGSEG